MPNVRGQSLRKHQRFLKTHAYGFWNRHGRCWRIGKNKVIHSWLHAKRGRIYRKREARRLWNYRIGAAAVEHDIAYSRFMGAIRKDNIALNRKMLADLALNEPYTFREIAEHSKQSCVKYFIPPSHYYIHKNY